MKKLMKATAPDAEELGRWLGRHDAFAAMAGRCSAADAESLRRMRDGKIYRKAGLTWEEFCRTRVGTSRQHVDRTLRLLDEFGPAYFHVAQLAHVTPDEYRAIAPHVGPDGVKVDGAVVALLPENSERVSAAIAELIRRGKPAPQPPARVSHETIVKRCDALRDTILALDSVDPLQKVELVRAAVALLGAAGSRRAVRPDAQ